MGISSDGIIAFGIDMGEGDDLPWLVDEKWDGDHERWWREEVCGYEPPFHLFTEEGQWIDGVEAPKEKVSEYYEHRSEFEALHPFPIDVVLHCSFAYGMYILAVPGTVRSASRGYPKSFDVADLTVTADQVKALLDFCIQYGIEHDDEPTWWLTSLYG